MSATRSAPSVREGQPSSPPARRVTSTTCTVRAGYAVGGSKNPSTARCTATANGITCPAAGNGYGVYAQWDVMPGIHLDAEGATWNDNVFGTNDSGANITATWDLSTLLNACCNLTASTGYAYYGVNFYPPYGPAQAHTPRDILARLYPGKAQCPTCVCTA